MLAFLYFLCAERGGLPHLWHLAPLRAPRVHQVNGAHQRHTTALQIRGRSSPNVFGVCSTNQEKQDVRFIKTWCQINHEEHQYIPVSSTRSPVYQHVGNKWQQQCPLGSFSVQLLGHQNELGRPGSLGVLLQL